MRMPPKTENKVTREMLSPSKVNREMRSLIERQVVDILNFGEPAQLMDLYGVGPKRAKYIMGEKKGKALGKRALRRKKSRW